MIELGNLTGIVVLFLTSNRGDLNHESWGAHHHWRLSPYGSTIGGRGWNCSRSVCWYLDKDKVPRQGEDQASGHWVDPSCWKLWPFTTTYHLGMVYKVYTTSLWWFWGWFIIGFTMVLHTFHRVILTRQVQALRAISWQDLQSSLKCCGGTRVAWQGRLHQIPLSLMWSLVNVYSSLLEMDIESSLIYWKLWFPTVMLVYQVTFGVCAPSWFPSKVWSEMAQMWREDLGAKADPLRYGLLGIWLSFPLTPNGNPQWKPPVETPNGNIWKPWTYPQWETMV